MQKFFTLTITATVAMVMFASTASAHPNTLSPAQAKARKAAAALAKEISKRDAVVARKFEDLESKLRKARGSLSAAKRWTAKIRKDLASDTNRVNANTRALLMQRYSEWQTHAQKLEFRVAELEKKGQHVCAGLVNSDVQKQCLIVLQNKDNQATERVKVKEDAKTKRRKNFLETAAFMHTRCKDGKDAEGSKLNCAKGKTPNGKVKLKVLRNGKLSKEVYEFTPSTQATSPVVMTAPLTGNRWAEPKRVVGTPDNGFQPLKGWSAGKVYCLAGFGGAAAGYGIGWLSGKKGTKSTNGNVKTGTQVRNGVIGALVGGGLSMLGTAAWRAATSD